MAAKGKKVERFDLSDVAAEDVVDHLLGATGNLRAPTMIVGDRVFVGFPKDGFEEFEG